MFYSCPIYIEKAFGIMVGVYMWCDMVQGLLHYSFWFIRVCCHCHIFLSDIKTLLLHSFSSVKILKKKWLLPYSFEKYKQKTLGIIEDKI